VSQTGEAQFVLRVPLIPFYGCLTFAGVFVVHDAFPFFEPRC
jgi:hypothetical protein